MCVYVSVYLLRCPWLYMRVCNVCMHSDVNMSVCLCVSVYGYLCVGVHVCLCSVYVCTCMHTHAGACPHLGTYKGLCVSAHVHVCLCVFVCVCVCVWYCLVGPYKYNFTVCFTVWFILFIYQLHSFWLIYIFTYGHFQGALEDFLTAIFVIWE